MRASENGLGTLRAMRRGVVVAPNRASRERALVAALGTWEWHTSWVIAQSRFCGAQGSRYVSNTALNSDTSHTQRLVAW
jgi:hypothetical protein